ncbi:hypothetical protein LINPERHAP1_LOCUS22092 [Linum perenne]
MHTFYMSEGEFIVTLKDVFIITGLPINGGVVTRWDVSNDGIQMINDF